VHIQIFNKTFKALNCNDRAVVAKEDDCPEIDANVLKKESMFEAWTSWSDCSVSCGSTGIQKRWRKCGGKETVSLILIKLINFFGI
jgi:hypothetical protein